MPCRMKMVDLTLRRVGIITALRAGRGRWESLLVGQGGYGPSEGGAPRFVKAQYVSQVAARRLSPDALLANNRSRVNRFIGYPMHCAENLIVGVQHCAKGCHDTAILR